jgi:hypothetical protein
MSAHVTTFLGFALRRGFVLSALGGLASTFVSSYRRLQREVGLASYTPEKIVGLLERHGFHPERLPRNIAVSPHRSSFLARKPDAESDEAPYTSQAREN